MKQMHTTNLQGLYRISQDLPSTPRLPVLFTSHGNPMDIPLSREERPFWNTLHHLGRQLKERYPIRAAMVVSAHWCTRGTFVNVSPEQKQIYDFYGFPKHYYEVKYRAAGAPEVAKEVQKLSPRLITESTEWGLDHGAWPMLMHLFPEGDVPVFELSIDYYADPHYHYDLGRQLQSLREKGVLVIGSGSLIHNLPLAMQKMQKNDSQLYGWEAEYDAWLKKQLDQREVEKLIRYHDSHPLGKLAAPTPDHYVPVLYTLGMMDSKDVLRYFYEAPPALPAFSERSFVLGDMEWTAKE